MNRIWIVKFPSHQTHLIQPADVGCLRPWKAFQQKRIMNAIRSHEAEYNVQSFFRGLPKIRERTFTTRTIKHSFQNAGMWPVSFKAVQKKLKEYEKKKKDAGLEFLEYGPESEPEGRGEREEGREFEPEPEADPQLMEEYPLPPLTQLRHPSSHDECHSALQSIEDKV